jgi:hypothetical protein
MVEPSGLGTRGEQAARLPQFPTPAARGRLRLIPVAELERCLNLNAADRCPSTSRARRSAELGELYSKQENEAANGQDTTSPTQ